MTAIHCPENNLNLRRKAKPVTAGADATICQVFVHKFSIRPRNQLYVYTYTVASALSMAGSVLMHRFTSMLGQCTYC